MCLHAHTHKRKVWIKSHQIEKADMATDAFFKYPANKSMIALYHNSKLLKIRKKKSNN